MLAHAGWDVERDGLTGAPRIRVVVGEQRHSTIDRALRMLGLGAPTDVVPADDKGRMLASELELGDEPTIVCAQAGDVNTGAFDPFDAIADARDAARERVAARRRRVRPVGRRLRRCATSSPASSAPTRGRPTRTSG